MQQKDNSLVTITEQVRDLYCSLRVQLMKKWRRCLPFSEFFVDRWEKAEYLGFGQGSSIYDTSYVYGDVRVGNDTWIGPFTLLDGVGGLTIGNSCSISAGVQIYTHDSVDWAISGGESGINSSKTTIGSRCYIGPNTIIAKGVTIGEGCIIGAMSLVLHDIPAHSKAWGVPAIVKGKVESNFIPDRQD